MRKLKFAVFTDSFFPAGGGTEQASYTICKTLKGYGASERITDNENGFLSNYNIKDFSNRIYNIVQDKTLYNHVCQNVHTIYGESWKQIAKKYEELFKGLIEKRK